MTITWTKRALSVLLSCAVLFSVMATTVFSVAAAVEAEYLDSMIEFDGGTMARWVLGPPGYDDGYPSATPAGTDVAEKLINGDRRVKFSNIDGTNYNVDSNNAVTGMRASLPVGSYNFKFTARIRRGTNTVETANPFHVSVTSNPAAAAGPSMIGTPMLRDIPNDQWVTIRVPFVINNSSAYVNHEYKIRGAISPVIGGSNAEAWIGREIVIERSNSTMQRQDIAAIFVTNDQYSSDVTARGNLGIDKTLTYDGAEDMYSFVAELPRGQYYAKFVTKTSQVRAGTSLNREIAMFTSDRGLSVRLPMLEEYNDDEWKNVTIPFTVSNADDSYPITYKISGPKNGALDLSLSEYILICRNDSPLPVPQQAWRERYIPANHMALGVGMSESSWSGSTVPSYDTANGYYMLPRGVNADGLFANGIRMRVSRQQFVNSGHISHGKAYIKIVAKVPEVASAQMRNTRLFRFDVLADEAPLGGTTGLVGPSYPEIDITYGVFTAANEYQTIIREFDVPDEFFGAGSTTAFELVINGRFYRNVSDLHIKSLTISPYFATDEYAEPNKPSMPDNDIEHQFIPFVDRGYNIIWPAGQPMPSFGKPAEVMDFIGTSNATREDRNSLICLQGLVNRIQPRIAIGGAEPLLSAQGAKYFPFAAGKDTPTRIRDTISKYRNDFRGFILYGSGSSGHVQSQIATTLGGMYNALPVTQQMLDSLRNAPYNFRPVDYPVFVDLTGHNWPDNQTGEIAAATWLYNNYRPDPGTPGGSMRSDGNPSYYTRAFLLGNTGGDRIPNRDLAIAVLAPVTYLNPSGDSRDALTPFFEDMRDNHNGGLDAIQLGFHAEDEGGYINMGTRHGVTSVPSDYLENYTAYAGMSRIIDPPTVPKKPDLVGGKAYLSKSLSDGDNIAYVTGSMRGYVNNSSRSGAYPLNWTFTAAMLDYAPQLMQWYFDTATDGDLYIAGPSGYGYTKAENWPNSATGASSVLLKDGTRGTWTQGYAELNNDYNERTQIGYPTIWGGAGGEGSVYTGFPFTKYSSFADFNLYPSLGGAYFMNSWESGTVRRKSTLGPAYLHRFNWFNYRGDWDYAGDNIFLEPRPGIPANSGGSIAQRITHRATTSKPANDTNTFDSFQVEVWAEDVGRVPNMNKWYHFFANNDPYKDVIRFLRSDHYFMLLNEHEGQPINNALQMEAFASGHDGGYTPGKVTDGSFGRSHGWRTSKKDGDGKQWVAVDFGKRQTITRYVVKNAELAGFNPDLNTKSWEFQASIDGKVWTTLETVENNEKATYYSDYNQDLGSGARYRYARILINDPGSDDVARIQDLEVYGVNNWDRADQTYTTYRTELEQFINDAETRTQSEYTTTSWTAMQNLKDTADTISGSADNSSTYSQAEVDDAAAALEEALGKLIRTDGSSEDCQVTFTNGHGQVIAVINVAYGGTVTAPQAPEMTGYDFVGWDSALTGINDHITINAEWTIKEYDVVFYDNNEPMGLPQNAPHGGKVDPPTVGERPGYTFIGWDMDVNYVHGDRINAVWEVSKYPINYAGLSGAFNPNPLTYTYGEEFVLQPLAGIPGREFSRWTIDNVTVTSIPAGEMGAKTIMAQWTNLPYNITYVMGEGGVNNANNPSTGTYGTTVPVSAATRPGYTFRNWFTHPTNNATANRVTNISAEQVGDITLYAGWTSVSQALTYENLQGAAHSNPSSYLPENPVTTPPATFVDLAGIEMEDPGAATDTELEFAGWYDTAGYRVTLLPWYYAAPLTLTARWVSAGTQEYTINYNGLGDLRNPNPASYFEGAGFKLQIPEKRDGFTFLGWLDEDGAAITEISDTDAQDMEIFASWQGTVYNIEYADTKGAVNPNPATYESGTRLALLPLPDTEGYGFGGWKDEDDEIVTFVSEYQEGDITLTAVWQDLTSEIFYQNTKGADNPNPDTYIKGNGFILLDLEDVPGFKFNGWYNSLGEKVRAVSDEDFGTITLTAEWLPMFELIYDGNNGIGSLYETEEAVTEEFRVENNTFDAPDEDMIFAGWNTEPDGSGTAYAEGALIRMPNGGLTLYAQWILQPTEMYTLSYNLNGGTGDIPAGTSFWSGMIYTPAEWSFDAPDNDKEFNGWNSKPDGSGKVYLSGTTARMPANDLILYAQWLDISDREVFSLNFNAGDSGTGYAPPEEMLIDGLFFTAATNTFIAPAGMVFAGWNSEEDGSGEAAAAGSILVMRDADMTLYAQWISEDADTYTLTYNANDDEEDPAIVTVADKAAGSYFIQEDLDVIFGPDFEIPAGKFPLGWNTSQDGSGGSYVTGSTVVMPDEDLTLYVIWADLPPELYSILYDLNGGDGTVPVEDDLEEGQTFTAAGIANITAPSGKQFKEWNTVRAGTGTAYAPGSTVTVGKENLTLYAIWEDIPVVNRTVTFNGNGVPNPPSRTVASGTAIGTLPTVSRANHTFAGWFTANTGGTQVTAATIVNANMTVFARWTPATVTWTVTFMDGARNLTNLRKTVNNNTRVTSPKPPAKKNQTFVGWFTANTGGSQFNFGRNIVANVTLYARYERNPARPTKMKATRSKRKARVSWKKQNGVTVEIQQRIGAKGKWTRTGTTKKAGANSFTTKNLRKGRRYQFRARAIKRIAGRVVRSAWSGASKALLIR
ncbi:MAG: InlB B-repeat-containing protein [Oscillospiraceae bacterium]|nr:InlB B-repeat-containing protein [Oscillospiraceae bacterium]